MGNFFFSLNFPEMYSVGKASPLLKITFGTFLAMIVNCVYVYISSAAPQQNGGAYTNLLMSTQIA